MGQGKEKKIHGRHPVCMTGFIYEPMGDTFRDFQKYCQWLWSSCKSAGQEAIKLQPPLPPCPPFPLPAAQPGKT